MLQSKLFTKTLKDAPKDEVSLNAALLTRAGFIDKLAAGIYTYLPLGLRVLDKIKGIIREEINELGGQEIYMPALCPKENWLTTGRWDKMDVLFKLKGAGDKDFALGSTHEEVVTPLVKKFASSYKDLPCAVYQIQDKFRNEPRAKSGLLRGREFSMKDLYSFHADEKDFEEFYEKAKAAYLKIFKRCGLEAIITEASGGSFSKYSHEFQVLTEFGEDLIYYCDNCFYAQNKEIAEHKEGDTCPKCKKGKIKAGKAIEVGNIFPLKTKFSEAFDYKYIDEKGKPQPVLMGCYGIGPSRVLGAIVEIFHDDKGICWPEAVAPFKVHLLCLGKEEAVVKQAKKVYDELLKNNIEVLYDDRLEATAGQKFADADLIGLPCRLVVSGKTGEKVEFKKRTEEKAELVAMEKLVNSLR
ncbi:MAG: hypothetical protein A2663_04610 [Candidatus Buchananbacteria bacterium RIFCSPHIGHO2_01_FULL_46_12]|uniref:Proline--tRNA ligase n=1 Tax=Candidatus Buchananbacteria bacterium RIFCSPHIGHO2_01_FULL_46_12 TaxID=1797536 RepID=A0A1G1Y170_9BACT|nr:MAG: hypothetical protein A2663_04610 [Candidatus Buchananbacteria bacterium RIFCSPHIGHO2_01_FULL_46_12]